MTLEQLQARQQELTTAIANTTNSIYVLQGHKAEVDWQISQYNNTLELTKADEAGVDQAVVNSVENPVE